MRPLENKDRPFGTLRLGGVPCLGEAEDAALRVQAPLLPLVPLPVLTCLLGSSTEQLHQALVLPQCLLVPKDSGFIFGWDKFLAKKDQTTPVF